MFIFYTSLFVKCKSINKLFEKLNEVILDKVYILIFIILGVHYLPLEIARSKRYEAEQKFLGYIHTN